jgi:serine/threonine-protein kinase SRK2
VLLCAVLQTVPHLPLPLLKICDFGYSKEENKSAAKSKVGAQWGW